MKKIFITIFILIFSFFLISANNVYCEDNTTNNLQSIIDDSKIGGGFNSNDIQYNNNVNNSLKDPISRVWGIVLTALQVAAIAGVIYAGVRYMYSSSDQRADLKKSMISLIIGMVIVFTGSTVVQIVINLFNDVT